ncbi:MAG: SseB family protein, partial [Alphaproteobacteria bacterium]
MIGPTPLDRAHAAMAAAPENEAARLAFYRRLADAELFVMLREEPQGAEIEPEVFEVAGVPHVLAFDTEARLADFAARPAGSPVAHVALSGRTLARLLAAQGVGLGLNLGVRASE